MTFLRRRWFILVALLALAVGAWSWWAMSHALWVTSARKIEKGMTLEEVVSRLGRRPDAILQYPMVQSSWNDVFGNVRFHPPRSTASWNAIDGVVRCVIAGDQITDVDIQETGVIRTQMSRLRKN